MVVAEVVRTFDDSWCGPKLLTSSATQKFRCHAALEAFSAQRRLESDSPPARAQRGNTERDLVTTEYFSEERLFTDIELAQPFPNR